MAEALGLFAWAVIESGFMGSAVIASGSAVC